MTRAERHPRNRYGVYHLPEGVEHRPAARAILSGEVYEPETIDFIRRNAGDGDIIHAGAFFGDFLPGLSSGLAEGRKVWAFEPNPESHAAACKTVEMNRLANVELVNAALSDRAAGVLLRTHQDDGRALGGASRVVSDAGDGVRAVASVMLDFAVPLERRVSILHLDVEGHEKAALRGAFHIVSRWRPILILEFFSDLRWLSRTFRGSGYRQVDKLNRNWVFIADPPEG